MRFLQVRELQEDLDAMSRTYDNLAAEEGTIGNQVRFIMVKNLQNNSHCFTVNEFKIRIKLIFIHFFSYLL